MVTEITSKYASHCIPALEKFKVSLETRCKAIMLKEDPQYIDNCVDRLMKIDFLTSKPKIVIEEVKPLLAHNYSSLARLIGSLYEVKRGWNRLSDIYYLIDTNPPIMKKRQIEADQWWRLCFDFFWYADYGYSAKFTAFLTKFQRILALNDNIIYMNIINDSKSTIKALHETTKKFRDPIAHTQSFFDDEQAIEVFWQIYLVYGCKAAFISEPLDILDSFSKLNQFSVSKDISDWFKFKYKTTNQIFTQLNKIPLKKLNLLKDKRIS